MRDFLDRDQLFNAVIQASGDAIVATMLDGRIAFWNRAAHELFGHDRGEAVGNSLDMVVGPHDRGMTLAGVARIGEGDRVEPFESIYQHKDGRRLDVALTIAPVIAQDGAVSGAALIIRDLGAQKFAEAKFRLAVEACPCGILMIDATGTIVLANRELERLFEYSRGELIGQSLELLLPERLRTTHRNMRNQFAASPSMRLMTARRGLTGRRKDGGEFPVEIGLNPIQSPRELFILTSLIDISERTRAESALFAHTDALERSNAELEQFAYVASHDLQEPLRMVASYTQLLSERYHDKLDARGEKYIRYAMEGAKRMQDLVRDLLAYSRISAKVRTLQAVDPAAVVRAVLDALAAVIEESKAEITVNPLPMVRCDETEFRQLMQNLIANAVKFRTDRPVRVTVSARRQGDQVEFAVADNGIGIDPRYHDRIFLMFQRLHERAKYDGSGIGLAVAEKIVGRHGGKIWVKSEPGHGAIFHFTLPAQIGDAA